MMRFLMPGVLCIRLLCPQAAMALPPAQACRLAAAWAERQWHLPANLVAAIGEVESGRHDPASRRPAPWPWTVNANGTGAYFPTREEAVAFVRALWAQGVRFIDVGCFQIDLLYHPHAFASLEEAFDPALNADYAARLLLLLHAQTGSWQAAVARYHSARATEGAAYQARVLDAWQSSQVADGPATAPALRYGAPPAAAPDRFVVLMSAAARAIRIIRPSAGN